jgi:hypothetical protein
MSRNSLNVVVAAASALLLVFMVLMFISVNPWLLYGVAAVLWAIAEIVKAIHGVSGRGGLGRRDAADPRELTGRGDDVEHDGGQHDEADAPDGGGDE